MKARDQQFTDHEVRLQMVENAVISIDKRFDQIDKRFDQIDKIFERIDRRFNKIDERMDRIESTIDSHFMWLMGVILTSIIANVALFGSVALHAAKLI